MNFSKDYMDKTIMFERFIIPYEASGQDPIHIEMAGISHCDGSYRIQRRDSSCYVLESIAEGEGVLEVNGRRFHPRAGDVYLIPLHSDHVYYSENQHPWIKYWFNVTGAGFDACVRACGISDVVLFPQYHLEKAFLEALQGLEAQRHETMLDLGAGHVMRLIRQLHQIYCQRQQAHHPISSEALDLKDFLERHICSTPPSIQQLCRVCNRSEVQMRRLFKQAFDISPMAFLLNAKLMLAKQLLESTDISIKELACMLGFADQMYFSRLFKRKVGVSPTCYQQQASTRPDRQTF